MDMALDLALATGTDFRHALVMDMDFRQALAMDMDFRHDPATDTDFRQCQAVTDSQVATMDSRVVTMGSRVVMADSPLLKDRVHKLKAAMRSRVHWVPAGSRAPADSRDLRTDSPDRRA